MELKLRACPFCGGQAEIKAVQGRSGTRFLMAKCMSCGAQGHTCLDRQGGYEVAELGENPAARLAATFWNARVDG